MDKFDRSKIIALAVSSDLARYSWKGRGTAPSGYIKGMALVYARVFQHLLESEPVAREMAKPMSDDAGRDALAWYGTAQGLNERNTLRALFVLLIGLGMRESSGKHCEGRDTTARNVTADTAEAGLFQVSWNIHSASPLHRELFKVYKNTPPAYGLLDVFKDGVRCRPASAENFGEGEGAEFQLLTKEAPAFAAETAALGLRNLRKHWGPINRKEVEIRPEAEVLLRQIEALVTAAPQAPVVVKPEPWWLRALRKIMGA